MANESLKEILDKFPLGLLLAGYVCYLGFDVYAFRTLQDSPLAVKKAEVETTKARNGELDKKIKEVNQFLQSLDQKRTEIRSLAQELDGVKTVLPENIDVPAFMKMVVTEATRVGMDVISMKPEGVIKNEFYEEDAFKFTFSAVFVQVIAFLERMSNSTHLLRIDSLNLARTDRMKGKYVELEGTIEVKAYKYLGSKADHLGKAEESQKEVK